MQKIVVGLKPSCRTAAPQYFEERKLFITFCAEKHGEKMRKTFTIILIIISCTLCTLTIFATPDVAGAIESTWTATQTQIKTVVNNVVFPVLDAVLAIFFFIKLGSTYFDYRKSGQFEWTAPVILFACLLFTLSAPSFLWGILGW